MRILYLAQRVPYPPNRGDRILTYHEIRVLSQVMGHEVHVAALAETPEDVEQADALRQMCPTVDVSLLPGWRSKAQAAMMAASPLPLTLPYFFSPSLAAKVAYRVATVRPDVIQVFSSSMAQYADPFVHLPRVMHFADLDSLKWRQMGKMGKLPMSLVHSAEAVRLLWYERSIASRYDRCLVVTDEERDVLLEHIPGARVTVAPNGVDCEFFKPSDVEPEEDHLVFVGVMDYFPNEEGMEFFCHEVLPIIHRSHPKCRITIVGARPSEKVLALGSLTGVTVTGSVDDVRPYVARATLAVVPLRVARGIQNKVLEAMAMGKAVVASESAFMGVDAEVGTHALVADEPEELASRVIELLEDRDRRERMGAAARQIMVEGYSWEAQVAKVEAVYEEILCARHGRCGAA